MKLRYLLVFVITALVILTVYGGTESSGERYSESKDQVILRKIVHELLLRAGDSSSRVLPVKQISPEEFHVFTEKPLAVSPDSFMQIVSHMVTQYRLPDNFTANVMNCASNEMAYGFAVARTAAENVPTCVGRDLPKDCYYFSFIFPAKKSKEPAKKFYIGGILIACTALALLWRKKKHVPAVEKAPESGYINDGHTPIGNYDFHPVYQYLELNGERTSLTSKESKLLAILSRSPNIVVERNLLQKEIWENEGVIVTRSLDMFISKLRKKLTGDPAVRIVNAHGKGYKLEIIT